MRINKYLAACGLGSRRSMDELVSAGRVAVNGVCVDTPGVQIDPARDTVTVDGKSVRQENSTRIYLFNKPTGYLTTMSDPRGRPTVAEFVQDLPQRVYPVGRLDLDTSGLLLFTNDGELAHRLAHPSFGVEKEYRVKVRGRLSSRQIRQLEQGVVLEEGTTSPARVVFSEPGERTSRFHLVLHEGWKRQVRRMCSAVGLPVLSLERVRYAFLSLEGVAPGRIRPLTAAEYRRLQELCRLK